MGLCYRVIEFLLLALAIVAGLAVFMPWQRLFLMSDEQATTWLAAKMLLLPVPVLCILGAIWCAHKCRRSHA
jgi:uncharacterized membrane protein YdjX (TVP38/TMEM64 family)